MTGVEILATQEVATAFEFSWASFWFAVAFFMVTFVTIGSIISVADGDAFGIVALSVMGVIASVIFAPIAGLAEQVPTEYATQYKVIISDEVPMNDFLEKYEIVDQEGEIYTVIEKAAQRSE